LAMPGMFGLELSAQLLQRQPGLPIILASGNINSVDEGELEAAGICEVLPKPYRPQSLLSAIARLTMPRRT
jgi:CheY-like chemotaxis protein